MGVLVEDLVFVKLELLGELVPPGGDGGLDVRLSLLPDIDVVEGSSVAGAQDVSGDGPPFSSTPCPPCRCG